METSLHSGRIPENPVYTEIRENSRRLRATIYMHGVYALHRSYRALAEAQQRFGTSSTRLTQYVEDVMRGQGYVYMLRRDVAQSFDLNESSQASLGTLESADVAMQFAEYGQLGKAARKLDELPEDDPFKQRAMSLGLRGEVIEVLKFG